VIKRRWNQRRRQNAAQHTTTAPLMHVANATAPAYTPAPSATSTLLSPSANNLAGPFLQSQAPNAATSSAPPLPPSYQQALLCPTVFNTFHVSTGDISPFATSDVIGDGGGSSNRRCKPTCISSFTTSGVIGSGSGGGSKRHCDVNTASSAADP